MKIENYQILQNIISTVTVNTGPISLIYKVFKNKMERLENKWRRGSENVGNFIKNKNCLEISQFY